MQRGQPTSDGAGFVIESPVRLGPVERPVEFDAGGIGQQPLERNAHLDAAPPKRYGNR